MSTSRALPFGLLNRDEMPMIERGYEVYPEIHSYDPHTQLVQFISFGATSPTTISNCAGTTGVINKDNDESNDDTGTD